MLAAERNAISSRLSRLGFAAEVEEIHRLDDSPLHAFSSDTIIENLYRRAEAQATGEGNRFLAVLYQDAAKGSAALTVDPDFETLRKFSANDLDIKKRPIKFVRLEAISNIKTRPPLPPVVNKAIGKLAEVYGGGRLAQARVVVLRHFQRQGFDGRAFEKALAETRTTKDAWRRLVELGTPPPPAETALRDIFLDTMAGSAALSVDPDALKIMEELSKELPPELDRYMQVEDQLESRKLQMEEAKKIGQPGKTRPKEILGIIGRVGDGPRTGPGGGPAAGPGSSAGGGPRAGPGGGPAAGPGSSAGGGPRTGPERRAHCWLPGQAPCWARRRAHCWLRGREQDGCSTAKQLFGNWECRIEPIFQRLQSLHERNL